MEKIYGIIKEVFIPNVDNIDIMLSTKIGFIVEINNNAFRLELEQNEENARIMKNDKVMIIKQKEKDKEFIDIRKIEDAVYE